MKNVRSELIEKLEAIEDPEGRNIGTKAYRAEELYKEVNGVAPDLIVYFRGSWMALGGERGNGRHSHI